MVGPWSLHAVTCRYMYWQGIVFPLIMVGHCIGAGIGMSVGAPIFEFFRFPIDEISARWGGDPGGSRLNTWPDHEPHHDRSCNRRNRRLRGSWRGGSAIWERVFVARAYHQSTAEPVSCPDGHCPHCASGDEHSLVPPFQQAPSWVGRWATAWGVGSWRARCTRRSAPPS